MPAIIARLGADEVLPLLKGKLRCASCGSPAPKLEFGRLERG